MEDPRSDRLHTEMPVHPFPLPGHCDVFLRLVREHLGRDGRRVRIRGGVATVAGYAGQIGLTNLAQMCCQAPPVEWSRIVAEHLDKSREDRAHALAEELIGGRFDQLAGKLAVRIHPDDFVPAALAPHIVHRRDLPGTVTVLVADLGPSALAVPVPIADEWGVPSEQLFELGLQNVYALAPTTWGSLPLPTDVRLDVLLCSHFYTASHVLMLHRSAPRTGRHGNLTAVPHRSALLSFAIDDATVLRAMEGLLIMAAGMYREGPGSISPHVYWRTPEGRFEVQQSITQGKRARFAPSPGFAQVLEGLRSASG